MDLLNKHYIKVDSNGYVIGSFSDSFEQPNEDDIFIEEGGRHYNLDLIKPDGSYNYKYVDGMIVENTDIDLTRLKAAKVSEITSACNNEINSQFTSSVSGELHTYGYNEKDQFNMMKQSKVFDLNHELNQIFWSTKDGIVQLTKEQFNNLLLEAAAREQSIWEKYFTLKTQIDSATTPEELEVITW